MAADDCVFVLANNDGETHNLNYDITFKAMAVRRFNRRWHGKRAAARTSAMAIYMLLITCAIVSALYWQHTREITTSSGSGEAPRADTCEPRDTP